MEIKDIKDGGRVIRLVELPPENPQMIETFKRLEEIRKIIHEAMGAKSRK